MLFEPHSEIVIFKSILIIDWLNFDFFVYDYYYEHCDIFSELHSLRCFVPISISLIIFDFLEKENSSKHKKDFPRK